MTSPLRTLRRFKSTTVFKPVQCVRILKNFAFLKTNKTKKTKRKTNQNKKAKSQRVRRLTEPEPSPREPPLHPQPQPREDI